MQRNWKIESRLKWIILGAVSLVPGELWARTNTLYLEKVVIYQDKNTTVDVPPPSGERLQIWVKGDFTRWEYAAGQPATTNRPVIIRRGSEVFQLMKSIKTAIRSPYRPSWKNFEDPQTIKKFHVALMAHGGQHKRMEKQGDDNVDVYGLTNLKEGSGEFTYQLQVSQKTGLPKRFDIDAPRGKATHTYEKIILDEPIDDSLFEIPADFTIQDSTAQ